MFLDSTQSAYENIIIILTLNVYLLCKNTVLVQPGSVFNRIHLANVTTILLVIQKVIAQCESD